MIQTAPSARPLLRMTPLAWLLLLIGAALMVCIFYDGLRHMAGWWTNRDEYSHGWLIPPIVAFLIWQRRDRLHRLEFTGSWLGVAIMIAGLVLFLMGELSTLYTIVQYAFVLTLVGLVLAYTGWNAFRVIAIALLLLVFMVPLPEFLYGNLSQKLQLISSQIGVGVIRLFGISVFLEGNVIDLGNYKLQVVDACSGLRYLFPLMTLGVIVAIFFRAPLWQRIVVFVSTVPITVLMNSFRIGVIGVLVDKRGTEQAEGFLHDFEGWVIFMACFALLFAEMWLIVRLSGDRRPFRDIFALDLPPPVPRGAPTAHRRVPASTWAAIAVLAFAVAPALMLPDRAEATPQRNDFSDFPMQIESWSGRRDEMEQIYLDALKLEDYLIANYRNEQSGLVNLYLAYYDSQRKGESVHSPRSCLPGGGWVIKEFDQRAIEGPQAGARAIEVNRTLIAHGDQRQLVYYWFQQRGRNITNEYAAKWYLFWDALTRNRTDGALIRLITPLEAGEDPALADMRLTRFTNAIYPLLEPYVPD